jgi:hypothetical protein
MAWLAILAAPPALSNTGIAALAISAPPGKAPM